MSTVCEQFGWLIGFQIHGHGSKWWGFNQTPDSYSDWCSDVNNAIWFSRREDAERMRLHIIASDGLTGDHDYEKQILISEYKGVRGNAVEPDDGGPAFPTEPNPQVGRFKHLGMTLRDYFAAQVISTIITARVAENWTIKGMARHAYDIADEMLEARKK